MAGKQVLVVDDEAQIVDVLERFLTREGFEVKKAYDGKHGFSILKEKEDIDLVILDEKMPGMRGAAIIKELKSMGRKVPVILMSGSVSVAQLKNPLTKACKHVLIKPVRLIDLLKLINRILKPKKRALHKRGKSN